MKGRDKQNGTAGRGGNSGSKNAERWKHNSGKLSGCSGGAHAWHQRLDNLDFGDRLAQF